jgi:hypothetical protein
VDKPWVVTGTDPNSVLKMQHRHSFNDYNAKKPKNAATASGFALLEFLIPLLDLRHKRANTAIGGSGVGFVLRWGLG